nr:hybrid signal transduction histidine kinase M [Tanacetum cinerariifolium]
MMINKYCTKIKSMANRLKNLDCQVSEKNLVIYAVNGLDSRFATLVEIICHREPLPTFETAHDGFFLGYSRVAKAFRVFSIRRQEKKPIMLHNEVDEVITQTNTEGDEINFNENRPFPDDEFLVPRISPTQSAYVNLPYVPSFDPLSVNNITIHDSVNSINHNINPSDDLPDSHVADNHPIHNEPDDFDLAETHVNKITKDHDSSINDVNTTINVEPSPTLISP